MTTTHTSPSTAVPRPRVDRPAGRRGRATSHRVLEISRPPGKVEIVVEKALAEIAAKLRDELRSAERTIADYGLTIEATRLRDRLARAASTDLERLLLATPGVPEALFNKAIAQQLEHEKELEAEAEAAVTDNSVRNIDGTLEKLHATSQRLEDSTERIASVLGNFAELLTPIIAAQAGKDPDGDRITSSGPPPAAGGTAPPARRTARKAAES